MMFSRAGAAKDKRTLAVDQAGKNGTQELVVRFGQVGYVSLSSFIPRIS
jgi:hypothetical protein